MQLKHSVVRRGGVTATQWYGGTRHISAVSIQENLRFSFTLPSKGGGDTQVQLDVSLKDLRELLKEVARERPEYARVFSECTQLSVSALLRLQAKLQAQPVPQADA